MPTNYGNIIDSSGNLSVTIIQAGQSAENNKVRLTNNITLTYEYVSGGEYLNGTQVTNNNGDIYWTSYWKENINTKGKINESPSLKLSSTTANIKGDNLQVKVNTKLDADVSDNRDNRSAEVKYIVSYKGINGDISTSVSSKSISPSGINQTYFNYPSPTLTTYIESDSSWATVNPKYISYTGSAISTESNDNALKFNINIAQNTPKLSGTFSGTASIKSNKANPLESTNSEVNLKASLSNYTQNIDKENSKSEERTAKITVSFAYNNASIGPTKKLETTITQSGGEIDVPTSMYTYNWSISNQNWASLSNDTGDDVNVIINDNSGSEAQIINPSVKVSSYTDQLSIDGGNTSISFTGSYNSVVPQVSTSQRSTTVTLNTKSNSTYITGNINSTTYTITQSGKSHETPSMTVTVSTTDSEITNKTVNANWNVTTNKIDDVNITIPSVKNDGSSSYHYNVNPVFTHSQFNATDANSDLYDTSFYGFTVTSGSREAVAEKNFIFNITAINNYGTTPSVSPNSIVVTRKGQDAIPYNYNKPILTVDSTISNYSWLNGPSNSELAISNWPQASASSHTDKTFNSSNVLTLSTNYYPKSKNTGTVSTSWASTSNSVTSNAQTKELIGPTINIKNSSQRSATIPVTLTTQNSNGDNVKSTGNIVITQKASSGTAQYRIEKQSDATWLTISPTTYINSGSNYNITVTEGNKGTVSGTLKSEASSSNTSVTKSNNTFTFPYSGADLTLSLSGITLTNGVDRTATLGAFLKSSDDLIVTGNYPINTTVTQSGLTPTATPSSTVSNTSLITTSTQFGSLTSGGTSKSIFNITPNYGSGGTATVTGNIYLEPSSSIVFNAGQTIKQTNNIKCNTSNITISGESNPSSPREGYITYTVKYSNTDKKEDVGVVYIKQEGQSIASIPNLTYLWSAKNSSGSTPDWLTLTNATSQTVTTSVSDNSATVSGQITGTADITGDNISSVSALGGSYTKTSVLNNYTNTAVSKSTNTRSASVYVTANVGDAWSSQLYKTVSQSGEIVPSVPTKNSYIWSYVTASNNANKWIHLNNTSNQIVSGEDVNKVTINIDSNLGSTTGKVDATVSILGGNTISYKGGEVKPVGSSTITNTIVNNDTKERTGFVYLDIYRKKNNTSYWLQTKDVETVKQAGYTWPNVVQSVSYNWTSDSSWLKLSDSTVINPTFTAESNEGSSSGTVIGSVSISNSNTANIPNYGTSTYFRTLTSVLSGFSNNINVTNKSARTATITFTEKATYKNGTTAFNKTATKSYTQGGSSFSKDLNAITYKWTYTSGTNWLGVLNNNTTSKTITVYAAPNIISNSGEFTATVGLTYTGTSTYKFTDSLNISKDTLVGGSTSARSTTVTLQESASYKDGYLKDSTAWKATNTIKITQDGGDTSVPGISYNWNIKVSNSLTNFSKNYTTHTITDTNNYYKISNNSITLLTSDDTTYNGEFTYTKPTLSNGMIEFTDPNGDTIINEIIGEELLIIVLYPNGAGQIEFLNGDIRNIIEENTIDIVEGSVTNYDISLTESRNPFWSGNKSIRLSNGFKDITDPFSLIDNYDVLWDITSPENINSLLPYLTVFDGDMNVVDPSNLNDEYYNVNVGKDSYLTLIIQKNTAENYGSISGNSTIKSSRTAYFIYNDTNTVTLTGSLVNYQNNKKIVSTEDRYCNITQHVIMGDKNGDWINTYSDPILIKQNGDSGVALSSSMTYTWNWTKIPNNVSIMPISVSTSKNVATVKSNSTYASTGSGTISGYIAYSEKMSFSDTGYFISNKLDQEANPEPNIPDDGIIA